MGLYAPFPGVDSEPPERRETRHQATRAGSQRSGLGSLLARKLRGNPSPAETPARWTSEPHRL